MKNKEFKSLDEQISIMKNKGLIIDDIDKTKDILLRENYFFINGYRMLFMKSKNEKKFIEGVSFDDIYAVFQFDRNLRNILFKNLLIVENNLKSVISYNFSRKYGIKEKNYLKASNFSQDIKKVRQVNDVLNKVKIEQLSLDFEYEEEYDPNED